MKTIVRKEEQDGGQVKKKQKAKPPPLPVFRTIVLDGQAWSFNKPTWLNYVLDGIEGRQKVPSDYGANLLAEIYSTRSMDWDESDWIAERDEMML